MSCSIWRKIPDVDPSYEVSFEGDVRRKQKDGTYKNVKMYYGTYGHGRKAYYFSLKDLNGKYRTMLAHRIVYTAFNGKQPKGTCVVHKNGIRSDNSLPNLILMTQSGIGKKHGYKARSKIVLKIDREGNVVDCFKSCKDAADHDNICSNSVCYRCRFMVDNPFDFTGYTYVYDDDRSIHRAEKEYGIKINYI